MTTFIYALACPTTGKIRYVGKANNPKKRLEAHLFRTGGNSHRACWIRSLQEQSLKPVLEIVDEVLESEWRQLEVAYIEFFREEGFDLVNGTGGGDGIHNPTKLTRLNMRVAQLGKKRSLDAVAKSKAGLSGENHWTFGKKFSPEHCAKISASKSGEKHPGFGKKQSSETIAKRVASRAATKQKLQKNKEEKN